MMLRSTARTTRRVILVACIACAISGTVAATSASALYRATVTCNTATLFAGPHTGNALGTAVWWDTFDMSNYTVVNGRVYGFAYGSNNQWGWIYTYCLSVF